MPIVASQKCALASEALAVPVLLGLGVDELSVSVPLIPTIKATVRELDLAEARSFARQGQPLRQPGIAALRNRFLAYAHDDGWYLKLFYRDWADVAQFLAAAVPASLGTLDLPALQRGEAGCWLQQGIAEKEMPNHDIDSVLNRRL